MNTIQGHYNLMEDLFATFVDMNTNEKDAR